MSRAASACSRQWSCSRCPDDGGVGRGRRRPDRLSPDLLSSAARAWPRCCSAAHQILATGELARRVGSWAAHACAQSVRPDRVRGRRSCCWPPASRRPSPNGCRRWPMWSRLASSSSRISSAASPDCCFCWSPGACAGGWMARTWRPLLILAAGIVFSLLRGLHVEQAAMLALDPAGFGALSPCLLPQDGSVDGELLGRVVAGGCGGPAWHIWLGFFILSARRLQPRSVVALRRRRGCASVPPRRSRHAHPVSNRRRRQLLRASRRPALGPDVPVTWRAPAQPSPPTPDAP